jgi:Cu/Ag efflux pump CusA
MTALVPGTWNVLGGIAFIAAGMCLAAALTYLGLTWRQDRVERTRPERRRWVTIEESNAQVRRRLVFVAAVILIVMALAAMGV